MEEEPSLAPAVRELRAELCATPRASGHPHACPEGLWFELLGVDPREWQEKTQNIYKTRLILIAGQLQRIAQQRAHENVGSNR